MPQPSQAEVRTRLVKFRRTTGITQYEVATALGISQTMVSGFELGRVELRLDQIKSLREWMQRVAIEKSSELIAGVA
jgi:predicted transcriptional regulator